MTYNPRSISQMYSQYGRSKSRQSSSKPSGIGSKPNTAGPRGFTRKSSSRSEPPKSTFQSIKERIAGLFRDSGANTSSTKSKPVKPDNIYDKDEFKVTIPKPPSVTVSSIGPDVDYSDPTQVPQSSAPTTYTPSFGRFGRNTSPMSSPSTPESAKFNIFDPMNTKEKVYRGSSKGLMSPPSPEKPTVGGRMSGINKALAIALAVPPTAAYTIQAGDTLSQIANATGTTVEELAAINNISNVDLIQAGKDLKVPIRRIEDQDTVTKAKSIKELEPVKASYDPDSEYYQSGVPLDQRTYAPEGEEYVPPEMTPPLNPPGNNIDFDFIAEQEGAAINKAYVPTKRDGSVDGNSGVTVATGVDLGSKDDAYFEGLDESITRKLRPHFGKKKAAAQTSIQTSPLVLTDSEVAALDRFVKEKELNDLRDQWNKDSDTDFDDLPTNKATAVASVYYQYKNNLVNKHNFWKQTTSGDWDAALDNLRDYEDPYPSRRNREADYLESGEM